MNGLVLQPILSLCSGAGGLDLGVHDAMNRPDTIPLTRITGTARWHHVRSFEDDLRGMGYGVACGLFTAAEVGAPHQRERLFILAYRDEREPDEREQQARPEQRERVVADPGLGQLPQSWGRTQARSMWKTPTSSEDAAGTVDGKMQQMLTHQAKHFRPSLPAPETPKHGSESSESAPTSRRQLNPRFVEWLMGWPVGWTSLVPLDCASRAMASSRPSPASPSEPSGDNWPTPDTQNSRGGQMRAEASKEADGKHAISLHHAVARWDVSPATPPARQGGYRE